MKKKRGFRIILLVVLMVSIATLSYSAQNSTLLEATSKQENTQQQELNLEKLDKLNNVIERKSMDEGKSALKKKLDDKKDSRYSTIEEKMEVIMDSENLAGTMTGVSIRNANTGKSLYSHFGNIQLRPASNMKILTGIAALEVLGPDYQFSTNLLTDGNVSGSMLEGNVYLQGKGDPTLLKDDFNQFAKDLKKQGIKKVKGNIIGDDTWFDDVRLSEDMSWDNEPSYVAAQISALTMSPNDDYDTGSVIVEVRPATKIGEPADVKTIPETDHVTIVNNSSTVDKGKSKNISIEREHGTNNIIIEGNIPYQGTLSRVWRSVWEPTDYVLDVFKKSLEEQNITLSNNTKIERGKTPEDAELLVSKDSMPLEDILIPFLKLSNNGHGEILTKEMGRSVYGEGNWSNGLQVINDVMSKFSIDVDAILLRDGSGMSDKTLIPAEKLSRLLYAVQDQDWFPIFENALPVAGESDRLVGGTLRNRMTDESTKGNVIAKTGSLTGVSTLSGYVTTADDEKLIFSLLMNNYISGSMTDIQDIIATELAEHEFK